MLEISESKTISKQAGKALTSKKTVDVYTATHKHKFAFFSGDPSGYEKLLKGREVKFTKGHGMFVDIFCDDDGSFTAFSVAMYGGIWAYRGVFNNPYYQGSLKVTLNKMTDSGGRNTERDFYGNFGGYETILSKNTYKNTCPNCGDVIVKETYLGGAIYYCPGCQPL